jgi:hypothetical protein
VLRFRSASRRAGPISSRTTWPARGWCGSCSWGCSYCSMIRASE